MQRRRAINGGLGRVWRVWLRCAIGLCAAAPAGADFEFDVCPAVDCSTAPGYGDLCSGDGPDIFGGVAVGCRSWLATPFSLPGAVSECPGDGFFGSLPIASYDGFLLEASRNFGDDGDVFWYACPFFSTTGTTSCFYGLVGAKNCAPEIGAGLPVGWLHFEAPWCWLPDVFVDRSDPGETVSIVGDFAADCAHGAHTQIHGVHAMALSDRPASSAFWPDDMRRSESVIRGMVYYRNSVDSGDPADVLGPLEVRAYSEPRQCSGSTFDATPRRTELSPAGAGGNLSGFSGTVSESVSGIDSGHARLHVAFSDFTPMGFSCNTGADDVCGANSNPDVDLDDQPYVEIDDELLDTSFLAEYFLAWRCADDQFSEGQALANGTQATAAAISPGRYENLVVTAPSSDDDSLCRRDYFAIDLRPSYSYRVQTFSPGTFDPIPSDAFTAEGQGFEGGDFVFQGDGAVLMTEKPEGTYRARAIAAAGVCDVSYDLEMRITGPDRIPSDGFEPNDTWPDATEVPVGDDPGILSIDHAEGYRSGDGTAVVDVDLDYFLPCDLDSMEPGQTVTRRWIRREAISTPTRAPFTCGMASTAGRWTSTRTWRSAASASSARWPLAASCLTPRIRRAARCPARTRSSGWTASTAAATGSTRISTRSRSIPSTTRRDAATSRVDRPAPRCPTCASISLLPASSAVSPVA